MVAQHARPAAVQFAEQFIQAHVVGQQHAFVPGQSFDVKTLCGVQTVEPESLTLAGIEGGALVQQLRRDHHLPFENGRLAGGFVGAHAKPSAQRTGRPLRGFNDQGPDTEVFAMCVSNARGSLPSGFTT